MTEGPSQEKLALLGMLMAGLAHEINTPLAAIRCNGDMLNLAFDKLEKVVQAPQDHGPADSGESVQELMEIVRDALHTNQLACDRLSDIARVVRNYVRLDEAAWAKADIEEILENALILVGHELKGRIQVSKEFAKVAPVECHPNQIIQVFINILVNAAQAITGTGTIAIKTWQDESMVYVSIADNGPGMTPEVRARIFDTGFTTKQPDFGTGLGLPLCLRTIHKHHGRLEVESVPGQGATFLVALPRVQNSDQVQKPDQAQDADQAQNADAENADVQNAERMTNGADQ